MPMPAISGLGMTGRNTPEFVRGMALVLAGLEGVRIGKGPQGRGAIGFRGRAKSIRHDMRTYTGAARRAFGALGLSRLESRGLCEVGHTPQVLPACMLRTLGRFFLPNSPPASCIAALSPGFPPRWNCRRTFSRAQKARPQKKTPPNAETSAGSLKGGPEGERPTASFQC